MTDEVVRPRALLIDFYDTLVEENEEPIREVCRSIAQETAEKVLWKKIIHEWFEIFPRLCYESFGEKFELEREIETGTIQILLDRYAVNLNAGELVDGLYHHWERPLIFPESEDVLAKCDVPVCMVSNADNDALKKAMEFSGLSFDLIVTSEDCRSYKPRPEMFNKALEMLGTKSGEVIHVGDSLYSDILGAKELDIPSLWINRQDHEPGEGDVYPDYVAPDLYGILDILNGKRPG